MWAGRPWASIRGTKKCTPCTTPIRFTPSTRCHSSRLVWSTGPAWPTPALLWSTSTAPSSANTRSASASTEAGSRTSAVCTVAWPPAAWISPATPVALASSTSTTCTLAPRRASSSAVERPMPEPAPVTTATLPAKSRSSLATEPPYR